MYTIAVDRYFYGHSTEAATYYSEVKDYSFALKSAVEWFLINITPFTSPSHLQDD